MREPSACRECVLKTLVCRGLRVGPSKARTSGGARKFEKRKFWFSIPVPYRTPSIWGEGVPAQFRGGPRKHCRTRGFGQFRPPNLPGCRGHDPPPHSIWLTGFLTTSLVGPNPLNLRGADSPPKFRGQRVQNPLF